MIYEDESCVNLDLGDRIFHPWRLKVPHFIENGLKLEYPVPEGLKGYRLSNSLRIEYSEKRDTDGSKLLENLGNKVFRLSSYDLEKIRRDIINFSRICSVYLDHNIDFGHLFHMFWNSISKLLSKNVDSSLQMTQNYRKTPEMDFPECVDISQKKSRGKIFIYPEVRVV